MQRRRLSQTARELYLQGRTLAKSGVSFDAWCHGVQVAGVPDLLEIDYNNDDLASIFEMGVAGTPVRWVEGWRYGHIPPSGRSTNYREQQSERGISVMELRDGTRTQDEISAMFIAAKGRPVVYVHGILSQHRGGDGEPLLICATEAAYGTYACYQEEL